MNDDSQGTAHDVPTCLGNLHVRVAGRGPVAVLWHSLLVDSTAWSRVENDLSSHRTLVMLDAPGHGRSSCPPRRFDIDSCARAALDVMDALDVETADWVGAAWGGRVGMTFAALYGARLRSLVTLSASPYQLPTMWRHEHASLVLAYRAFGALAPVTEAAMKTLLGERARRKDVDAAMLVSRAFLGAERGGLTRAVRNTLLRPEDLRYLLGRVRVPTLVVAGGADATFTAEDAQEVAALMPRARAEVLADVFRLAPVEQPTATVKLVVDHWERSDWD